MLVFCFTPFKNFSLYCNTHNVKQKSYTNSSATDYIQADQLYYLNISSDLFCFVVVLNTLVVLVYCIENFYLKICLGFFI